MTKCIPVVSFVVLLLFGGFGGSLRAHDKKPTLSEILDKLKKLRQERLDALRKEFDSRIQMVLTGRVSSDSLAECSGRLFGAELAVAEKPEDRIAACQAHLGRMVDYEKIGKVQFDAGRILLSDYLAIKAARL